MIEITLSPVSQTSFSNFTTMLKSNLKLTTDKLMKSEKHMQQFQQILKGTVLW